MGSPKDLTGQRFGRLVAIRPTIKYTKGGNRLRMWVCKCDCGGENCVSTHDLLIGHIKGCNNCAWHHSTKVIHKRLYDAWRMMIARCENPKAQAYKNYGQRGVSVCDEWHDFDAFLQWAFENNYSDDLSIDRINVNGDYEPNNCRWVSMKVQSNNRRTNCLIEYNGETHTISEWSEIKCISYHLLYDRIHYGWDIGDAFNRPVKKTHKEIKRGCMRNGYYWWFGYNFVHFILFTWNYRNYCNSQKT